MVAQNVVFWILAAAMVLAAIGVVRSQNVVHAALYLVVVMAGAAAQYILLAAEFVAWVQVIIYIGAVIILFLFGIMLTRAPDGRRHQPRQRPAVAGRGRRPVPRRRARHAADRRVRQQGDRISGAGGLQTLHTGKSATIADLIFRATSCRSRSSRSCCWPRSSAPS